MLSERIYQFRDTKELLLKLLELQKNEQALETGHLQMGERNINA